MRILVAKVYGDRLVRPQNETYYGNVNPIGPRACYDEGKRISETYVLTTTASKAWGSKLPASRSATAWHGRLLTLKSG